MSFQTGLSGLSASSKSLDVIGNNIANANTVGMKSSRAEFADLVASSLGIGNSGKVGGIGVSVATIAQQFTQGNINNTGNSLDVAIDGGGFFQISKQDGSAAYTRDGQFKLDKDGNIITNTGANLMGYPTDLKGMRTSSTPQKLSVPTNAPIPANATTLITAEFNLDASTKIAATQVPPTPIGTIGTSLKAFDSQGVALPVNLYFSKLDPANSGLVTTPADVPTDQWAIFDKTIDNTTVPPSAPAPIGFMTFDSTGKLSQTFDATLAPTATLGELPLTLTPAPPSIVPAFTPTLDIKGFTQSAGKFSISKLTQDGYTTGELTGLNIEPSGVITTQYSNGQTQARGQVALVEFRNVQGLTPTGSGEYLETFASGQPVQGSPASGKFGELRSGALEESNVDLTAELVNLMTAQRSYQANAQTIKTQDQVLSTLVNLR